MSRSTRREFVKQSAAISAGFWVAGATQAAPGEEKSANDKIAYACIGVGGKGQSDTRDASRHGDVVAICDIDESRVDSAAKLYPNAKKFSDFRKMFDEMGKSIDAVTVSTPDHTHAAAALMAMRMGKHCFTQKPLTHSIYEARQMANVAKEMGVKTQMGNQGTAGNALREAAAVLQSGALGKVSEVHVWTNRPIWPQGIDRPKETPPVPSTVNWEAWLGPAAYRPYSPAYHPFKWRGWWDFGTGALGDMACHTLNMPYMGLSLFDPTSVEAAHPGHNKETYPRSSKIVFEFPANDKRGPVTLTWYDGGEKPPAELLGDEKMPSSGALCVGEKGTLYSPGDYAGSYKLLGDVEKPEVDYVKSPGHFTEWAEAIKGGPEAMSNFPGYSGGLTETILLGNLAIWANKKVEWDAKNMVATNAPEVAQIIKPEYRKGYTL